MKRNTKVDAFEKFKQRAMKDKAFKREYLALDEEFSLYNQMLEARMSSGLTQEKLAKIIGTTQSAIARLESLDGEHSPTIATLKKYVEALGYRLQLKLIKTSSKKNLQNRSTNSLLTMTRKAA